MQYITTKNARIKKEKQSYIFNYTLLFVLTSLFAFSWYLFTGRTLIWGGDGWSQHYNALIYYSQYLRTIIKNLFINHAFSIPQWEFNLGEGSDILGTLHYYVIGDPFAFFSVFIPVRFMWLYYNVMIILRLYLSGIIFSFLCFYTGKNNKYAILSGAMTYIFCYWTILNAARHPYFLNPLLYLPMVILGVEKILRKERPYLLIVSVFLSAISNFFFFYMIVLITIIYVIFRLFFSFHKNIKLAIIMLFKIGIASILGVLMSAIIFLPSIYTFLNDSRMGVGHALHLFYPLSHYSKLPALFISPGESYWVCMGFSAPTLLAVILLFYKRKQFKLLKVLFLSCIIIFLIPIFGQILNGFSYMSNRWCWAFALLTAYIFTSMWPYLMELSKKDFFILFCGITLYFIACLMLEYSRTTKVFVSIGFTYIFFFLLTFKNNETFCHLNKQQIALLILILSIINNSFWKNATVGDNYASESKEMWKISEDLHSNETAAILTITQSEDTSNEFFRYSGHNLTANAGILEKLSSTRYYWSLTNPYISEFRARNELIGYVNTNNYLGYDDRTALISLASILYYAVPASDASPLPYGFSYIDTINVKDKFKAETLNLLKDELNVSELTTDQMKGIESSTTANYKVYRNDYALPLGYTYDNFISMNTWDKLSATEKQEALLQAVVLNNFTSDFAEAKLNFTSDQIEYGLTCNSNGISIVGNSFVVTSADSSITLNFEGLPNCETYFNIEGLNFKGIPVYDLYFGDVDVDPLNLYNKTNWNRLSYSTKESIRKNKLFWTDPISSQLKIKSSAGVSKTLTYYTNDFDFYNNRHNFTVNLDYSENPLNSVTITFSAVGIYTFNSIGITCQPMNHYIDQVNMLKENVLENIKIDINTVSGTLSLDSPKLLCLSIPYSKGWSAYVDNEKVPVYQANIQYMALDLPAGKHTVKLIYNTPLLKEGVYISLFFIIIFIIYIFASTKKH